MQPNYVGQKNLMVHLNTGFVGVRRESLQLKGEIVYSTIPEAVKIVMHIGPRVPKKRIFLRSPRIQKPTDAIGREISRMFVGLTFCGARTGIDRCLSY